MNNIFLKSINFKSGKVTYNDFNVDPFIPLIDQKFSLKEDMLQIDYGSYLIDVGWCPEFNVNGRFIISLVLNYDWDNIVYSAEVKNLVFFEESLQKTIDYCELLKSKESIPKA